MSSAVNENPTNLMDFWCDYKICSQVWQIVGIVQCCFKTGEELEKLAEENMSWAIWLSCFWLRQG